MPALEIIELNHVAVHTADVERSVAFYRDVLKLPPMPRPAFTFPGAWFRLGPVQELHLIGDRSNPVFSSHRGNHFALRVKDFAGWITHLQSLNVKFHGPQTRPDGARQLFVQDPDGHVIELCATEPEAHFP